MLRLFQVLTGVLLGMAVVALIFVLRPIDPEGHLDWDGGLWPQGEAPGFTLTGHHGVPVSLSDFRGRAVVVFFGFTHCPDVCPVTMAQLARTLDSLEDDGSRIQGLFITVDPARDSPERLREWLGNFHPSFLGLTGAEEEIREVAERYGAFFQSRAPEAAQEHGSGEGHSLGEEPTPGNDHSAHHAPPGSEPGAGYMVDHSGRAFVVAPNGSLAGSLLPFLEGAAMEAELRRVLGDR